MSESDINYEELSNVSSRMNDIIQRTSELIPEEHTHLLGQLSAMAIHLAFFALDILHHKNDTTKDDELKEMENQFTKKCGCRFKDITNESS